MYIQWVIDRNLIKKHILPKNIHTSTSLIHHHVASIDCKRCWQQVAISPLSSQCFKIFSSYSADLYWTPHSQYNETYLVKKGNQTGGCLGMIGLGTPGPCLGAADGAGAAAAAAVAAAAVAAAAAAGASAFQ